MAVRYGLLACLAHVATPARFLAVVPTHSAMPHHMCLLNLSCGQFRGVAQGTARCMCDHDGAQAVEWLHYSLRNLFVSLTVIRFKLV